MRLSRLEIGYGRPEANKKTKGLLKKIQEEDEKDMVDWKHMKDKMDSVGQKYLKDKKEVANQKTKIIWYVRCRKRQVTLWKTKPLVSLWNSKPYVTFFLKEK